LRADDRVERSRVQPSRAGLAGSGVVVLATTVVAALLTTNVALGASPSPSPSALPSPSVLAAPSALPSPSAGFEGDFGATEPIYADDFSDDTVWYVGEDDTTGYRYEDESYVVQTKTDDRTSWSYKVLKQSKPVVQVLGTVMAQSGLGTAAYLCMAGSGDA